MRRAKQFIAILGGLVLNLVSSPVHASTITWTYHGATTETVFSLAAGTPVVFTWSFNESRVNVCAGDPNASPGALLYTTNSLTLEIAGLTYQANGVLGNTGDKLSFPCTGSTFIELFTFSWVGPNLPSANLQISSIPFYWWVSTDPTLASAFLGSQPPTLQFYGPTFYNTSSFSETAQITAELQAVPEPASLLLLTTGILGLAIARRRRRAG